jgi:hypothetical protein
MDGQDGSGVWTKHVQLRLCSQVMAAFKGKKIASNYFYIFRTERK